MNALYVISGLGILTLVAEFANFRRLLTPLIFIGLLVAGWFVWIDWGTATTYFQEMLFFDQSSLAFAGLIIDVTLFWFWMASPWLQTESHQTDRMSLVLFVVAGAVLLCSFNNLAMLFLGIEIMSIPLYVLAGSRKESISSTEAAFKYFLMGSFATGFLLFGIALIYGATGSFNITTVSESLWISGDMAAFIYPGILLLLVGLAFKISAVPFHFWAPDVYEGSPSEITALMSTVVKIGAIAAFIRIFSALHEAFASWAVVLQVMMILTLIVPNITAVYQSSVKRMLAYSSVGHVGFLLLAFVAASAAGTRADGVIFYYLTAYSFSSLAAFAVLTIVERQTGSTSIDSFRGLNARHPLLAFTMTVAMMSLAGIPPLSGFFAKYMVLASALSQGYVIVVILAVAMSLVGVYYYFRVIVAMYFGEPSTSSDTVSTATKVLLILLVAAIVAVGIFPDLIRF
jgi:NADH-quinone oxidoreductase subunit N